jgi:hypothetical protein
MAQEKEVKVGNVCGRTKWHDHNGTGGGIYFLGAIGAAIYFLQSTIGFWPGVLAILKAFVWPAYLIYHLFGLLKI